MRGSPLRSLFALVTAAAFVAGALALSETPASAASAASAKAPKTTATVRFGAATDTLEQLSAFEAQAGKKVSLYLTYTSFATDPDFPTAHAAMVAARGATPFVTWEPWAPGAGVDQPQYRLAEIAGGAHDALLARWADQAKAFAKPVWIRFAHEMNGNWYPWAAGVNGNTAADYVAAYRHVVDVFRGAGVTNVTWVWNPNVVTGGASLASLYPGDAYVDWLGVDGYNWGTTQSWSAWQSPSAVFGATVAELRGLSRKPIVIGETASAELGGSKAKWISDFFGYLKANTDIKAFVWFNYLKETDWRIESSPTAQSAFRTAVADPRYL